MGKKRSNKKKKSPIENVSKNSNGEKNTESIFNSKLKEKNNCEGDSYLKTQNKLYHQSQSNETLLCKSSLEKNKKPDASHNASANNLSKKCKPSSVKPSSACNLLQTHKVKPVLVPFESKHPVSKNVISKSAFSSEREEKQYDYSVKKDLSLQSKFNNQREVPELLVKNFNDKLYLTDFLSNNCYESDKVIDSDFSQPVLNEYQNCTNSEKIDLRGNLHGINVENNYVDTVSSSQASMSATSSFDKDDLEISESRLELLSTLPSYSPNFSETGNFDGKIELKENISCQVNTYKNSKETFAKVYYSWLTRRKITLQKLKALLSEVHVDQLKCNKSQVACKKISRIARTAKNANNEVVSFLGSFTAFLTDAACGAVSVAQAFHIDSYQSKFKEIMEEDVKVTKHLYKERSNCVMKYQNIEETMRKFHPDSFSTTLNKISNSLEISKHWKAIQEAYEQDDMPQFLNNVNNFIDNAFQPTKLEEVKDTVLSYVSDNPNALQACKSAAQITYGYLDTFTLNKNQSPKLKDFSDVANMCLIAKDTSEINQLDYVISNDLPQSKLESQIEDAIDSLESEMEEMNQTYYELFKVYVDCNGSEWEISEMC